jgi:hypothetical protein
MQRQYASQGFAAVSVSLDPPDDKGAPSAVNRFLQKQKADFPSFILQAKEEEWQEKLNIHGPPCVYVLNRDNQFVLKQADAVNYETIEKAVRELLKK